MAKDASGQQEFIVNTEIIVKAVSENHAKALVEQLMHTGRIRIQGFEVGAAFPADES